MVEIGEFEYDDHASSRDVHIQGRVASVVVVETR
jgi:hypothetical protein